MADDKEKDKQKNMKTDEKENEKKAESGDKTDNKEAEDKKSDEKGKKDRGKKLKRRPQKTDDGKPKSPCHYHPEVKSIAQCHACDKRLCKDCIYKVNKKLTCLDCTREIREKVEKKPLTFGTWIKSFFLSILVALIPIVLWGGALAMLVWKGPFEDPTLAKVYDYVDRAYPLLGFLVLIMVGLGWRWGAKQARGVGAMFWATVVGVVLLLVMNFAHFYIYDHFYYPYRTVEWRINNYNEWAKTEYNEWVEDYNTWIRNTVADPLEQQEMYKSSIEYRIPKRIPYKYPIEEYRETYLEAYNNWISELKEKAPEYDKWAKANAKKTWSDKIPEHKKLTEPESFQAAIDNFVPYVKNIQTRLEVRKSEAKNAKVMLIIAWIIWISGILFGTLWMPRPVFVNIEPPASVKQAAAQKRREQIMEEKKKKDKEKDGDGPKDESEGEDKDDKKYSDKDKDDSSSDSESD
ncbi:MAG: hypothetical protein U5N86_12370 [Planctomycetota bacterium]|nr:hypothetical protein [Planctomycetota bacterium]